MCSVQHVKEIVGPKTGTLAALGLFGGGFIGGAIGLAIGGAGAAPGAKIGSSLGAAALGAYGAWSGNREAKADCREAKALALDAFQALDSLGK